MFDAWGNNFAQNFLESGAKLEGYLPSVDRSGRITLVESDSEPRYSKLNGTPGFQTPCQQKRNPYSQYIQKFRREESKALQSGLYADLQINPDASKTEIKQQYKKLLLVHHPDKGGRPSDYLKLKHAYEILKRPGLRRFYNEHGLEHLELLVAETDDLDELEEACNTYNEP